MDDSIGVSEEGYEKWPDCRTDSIVSGKGWPRLHAVMDAKT
ncbi:MAG: hypothetical protein OXI27_07695 [Thaumarchaeota archaeon]|nr:hypothetical protein [Nitrososphaerota archaeon]